MRVSSGELGFMKQMDLYWGPIEKGFCMGQLCEKRQRAQRGAENGWWG